MRPVVKLFVDPCQESDGAVLQGVADGLGFCGLLVVVAGSFVAEPGTAGFAVGFADVVRGKEVLEVEDGVGS